jgi:hypothetical protein
MKSDEIKIELEIRIFEVVPNPNYKPWKFWQRKTIRKLIDKEECEKTFGEKK